MNKQRAKTIEKLLGDVNLIKEQLSDLQSEEQDYFDNIPENLQDGEKAEKSQEAIDCLENINDNLVAVIDDLQTIIDNA